MPSLLSWLDHDVAERERTQRILALFQERESRDELGLGSVRDSLSDQFFPGTSTIQSRLRYMLFIPWMYMRFEEERVPSSQIATKARKFELDLIEPLLEQDDKDGVFGRVAGRRLKRLASSVYWAGLGAWGIRRFPGSQDEFHAALGGIYRQRVRSAAPEDGEPERGVLTWDPKIVEPPTDFALNPSLQLTTEEASYLRDRIVMSAPDSLFALLVARGYTARVDFPWDHPDQAHFARGHLELLAHARAFSEVMHGGAILYNLLLSESKHNAEWVDAYRERLFDWGESDFSSLDSWDIPRFWIMARTSTHKITQATVDFVEKWVSFVRSSARTLADNKKARELIRSREQMLKGPHSRLSNQRALDQWQGAAGLVRISYRWSTAQQFLLDLAVAEKSEVANA